MVNTNIKVGSVVLYVNENTGNAKVGNKCKAAPVATVYAAMSKGEARRLRKALRKQGFRRASAASRAA